MARYTGFFGGTCLTGHIDLDILPVGVLLNHLVHTGMDGVPQAVCGFYGTVNHRFFFHDGSSGRICNLIHQCQIIAGTAVGNGSGITSQLYRGICIGTLSHGRRCFTLIRNMRGAFIHFNTGFLIKSEHRCILGQLINTSCIIRFSVGSAQITETDTNSIEEVVTGLLNRCSQADGTVHTTAGMNPTVNMWLYIFEYTGTINRFSFGNHTFHHTGYGSYNLVSGTRSCQFLSCLIIERTGLVGYQFREVFFVHIIGQTIVVITRIRDTSQRFTIIRICDNHGTGAR